MKEFKVSKKRQKKKKERQKENQNVMDAHTTSSEHKTVLNMKKQRKR